MKTKTLLKMTFSALSIALLGGCSDSLSLEEELNEQIVDARLQNPIQKEKIKPGTKDLSAHDASVVAELYKSQSPNTRSVDNSIKDVVPINDKNGNPALYAVNFEDGYLLVSATTN